MKNVFSNIILALPALLSVASAETQFSFNENPAISLMGANGVAAYALDTEIAVAGSKSLLIGLSAEISLVTDTTVVAENGKGKSTSSAEAKVMGYVKYLTKTAYDEDFDSTALDVCESGGVDIALPGEVTFSARKQTLSAEVDLEVVGTNCTDCVITGYVEIGLALETTAAHHFNFIATGFDTCSSSDPCVVIACFDLSKDTEYDAGNNAHSGVGIGKAMLVVQEVLGYAN